MTCVCLCDTGSMCKGKVFFLLFCVEVNRLFKVIT